MPDVMYDINIIACVEANAHIKLIVSIKQMFAIKRAWSL